MTSSERETIIRWDASDSPISLYTADPVQMRRWTRLGATLTPISTTNGEPSGWQGTAEKGAVRLRRLLEGKVIRRKGNSRSGRANFGGSAAG